MSFLKQMEAWNLDIDRHLNRIIPASPLRRFPTTVSRFLGYRKQQQPDVGNVLGALYSCLGGFCGLAVIAAVFNNTSSIQLRHPPAFIASFGASAILEYNVIRSPLGQPRNALLGHTFSAIVGVAITKLFRLHSDFEKIKWIAGALSCGTASAVMLLTGTVHPPGGASAVLAATSPEITDMGWYFVGLVMLGTTLMLIVSLVINNIQRQFPVYWWTPADLSKAKPDDPESVLAEKHGVERKENVNAIDGELEKISISANGISLPDGLPLNSEEAGLLEALRDRLQKSLNQGIRRAPSSRPSTDCVTMVPSRKGSSAEPSIHNEG